MIADGGFINLPRIWYTVVQCKGGSRISGKGVKMCKGGGVRFADFSSFFFLSIP